MKKILLILMVGGIISGCAKFDDDINISPNNPSIASGTQLIASAALFLPDLTESPTGEFLAQYLAETQYPGASLYPEGGTSFYWLYQGPLMNLETVINSDELSGTQGPVNNQKAVAKILKAYFFWQATDRWGDIPYSEALKGAENFTPVYDTQESIYNSLFQLLKEATGMIEPGNITNDIIYGGNMNRWKMLGNTIRMLMALRLSEVDAAKGKAEFEQALAAGIMGSNSDNFVFKNLPNANNQSYWYGQVHDQNREWWALTELLVNELKPVDDPRLPVFGSPTKTGGEYLGLPFGTVDGMPNTTNFSLFGDAIWAQDAPAYLVTYAQALFAKAEAAKLGWIPGGDAEAQTNYELAIDQSLRQWTGSNAGLSDLLAQPGVTYDPATAIEQIATQRWIHLFMNGYEGWAEWRRTGYPNLQPPVGEPSHNVPSRQAYAETEKFNNESNYQDAVQRQFGGNNNISGKVWWDK